MKQWVTIFPLALLIYFGKHRIMSFNGQIVFIQLMATLSCACVHKQSWQIIHMPLLKFYCSSHVRYLGEHIIYKRDSIAYKHPMLKSTG
eukprot:c4534_g1_i2 orf=67-333(-)